MVTQRKQWNPSTTKCRSIHSVQGLLYALTLRSESLQGQSPKVR